MISKDDFFIKENKITTISDESYALMDTSVQFLDAFARTTYSSIYVIDYFRKNFLYVSDNPLFLCGMSAGVVKDMDFYFYINHVPEIDIPLLLEINKAGFDFIETIKPIERMEYTMSYDFHLSQPSGKPTLINHKITPLRLAQDGKVWLALCTVSLSSHTKSGNLEISKHGTNIKWRYNSNTKKWVEGIGVELNEYEKSVLILSAQGYTMIEISEKIHKSVDSVKTYRRKLFDKMDVNNITEAVSYALDKKLI